MGGVAARHDSKTLVDSHRPTDGRPLGPLPSPPAIWQQALPPGQLAQPARPASRPVWRGEMKRPSPPDDCFSFSGGHHHPSHQLRDAAAATPPGHRPTAQPARPASTPHQHAGAAEILAAAAAAERRRAGAAHVRRIRRRPCGGLPCEAQTPGREVWRWRQEQLMARPRPPQSCECGVRPVQHASLLAACPSGSTRGGPPRHRADRRLRGARLQHHTVARATPPCDDTASLGG